tara:strand:- start:463 stop:975 length:513 start_codon:yes stop_codon:yes gene_type:complete
MNASLKFIKSASGSAVSSLEVTNCFSSDYDVYEVTANFSKVTTNSNWARLRFIDSGGSVIADSEYDFASLSMFDYTGFGQEKGTAQTAIGRVAYMKTTGAGGGVKFTIYNPYDSGSYTFTNFQSSAGTTSQLWSSKVNGVHKVQEQITGLSIIGDSYTFDNIEINVFGVK